MTYFVQITHTPEGAIEPIPCAEVYAEVDSRIHMALDPGGSISVFDDAHRLLTWTPPHGTIQRGDLVNATAKVCG